MLPQKTLNLNRNMLRHIESCPHQPEHVLMERVVRSNPSLTHAIFNSVYTGYNRFTVDYPAVSVDEGMGTRCKYARRIMVLVWVDSRDIHEQNNHMPMHRAMKRVIHDYVKVVSSTARDKQSSLLKNRSWHQVNSANILPSALRSCR